MRSPSISAACARLSSADANVTHIKCIAKYVAVLYASTRNIGGKISLYTSACRDLAPVEYDRATTPRVARTPARSIHIVSHVHPPAPPPRDVPADRSA